MKKILIRSIIVLVGIFGIGIFVYPLLLNSHVNIGTVTGIVLFGMLFLYGVFMERLHEGFKRKWEKKWFKYLIRILIVLAVLILMLVNYLSYLMISAASSKPKTEVTVVVLGCAVHGNGPSLMLRERLDAAYKYLQEHPGTPCIVTGGQGADESMSEAKCMRDYLVAKGIDDSRIYMEDQATSTRENIEFSLSIIEEEGLPLDIAIVTNEFHEYRASQVAKKKGLTTYAVSGKTAWWLFPTYYFRELYGILYEKLL